MKKTHYFEGMDTQGCMSLKDDCRGKFFLYDNTSSDSVYLEVYDVVV